MIKLRKLLACLMIACMAFSLMPLAAFATEGEDGDVSGEPCTHVWQAADGKHVCSGCSEEAAHSFDSNGVCTVCGQIKPGEEPVKEPEHVHTFGPWTELDNNMDHARECVCGYFEVGEHDYVLIESTRVGNVVTEVFRCTVCGLEWRGSKI